MITSEKQQEENSMFCIRCGAKLSDTDRFCYRCGAQTMLAMKNAQQNSPQAEPAQQMMNAADPFMNQTVTASDMQEPKPEAEETDDSTLAAEPEQFFKKAENLSQEAEPAEDNESSGSTDDLVSDLEIPDGTSQEPERESGADLQELEVEDLKVHHDEVVLQNSMSEELYDDAPTIIVPPSEDEWDDEKTVIVSDIRRKVTEAPSESGKDKASEYSNTGVQPAEKLDSYSSQTYSQSDSDQSGADQPNYSQGGYGQPGYSLSDSGQIGANQPNYGQSNPIIVKAAAGIIALICAIICIRELVLDLPMLGYTISWIMYAPIYGIASLLQLFLSIIGAVLYGFMAFVMTLAVLKWQKKHTNSFMLVISTIAGVEVVLSIIVLILSMIRGIPISVFSMIAFMLWGVVAAVIFYLASLFCKAKPFEGMSTDDVKSSFGGAYSEVFGLVKGDEGSSQNAKGTYSSQAGYQSGYQQSSNGSASKATGQSAGGYNQSRADIPHSQIFVPLDSNRSLLKFIFFNLFTCGIYNLIFIHDLARDVNVACEGDGKETAGLLKLIVFGFLTCGIYTWYWYYSLADRLQDNAPRYGMQFKEGGTAVLLWFIVGIVACGLGPFIAMNILITNANAICMAYNNANMNRV